MSMRPAEPKERNEAFIAYKPFRWNFAGKPLTE
jgi:hypothetical protein